MLREAATPLVASHDLFMLDLDGVVYISGHAIEGVPQAIRRIREAGARVAFVTNNASRTAAAVAERLVALGVEAATEDVVTSAQAAAGLLVRRFGAGARVLMLGAAGLAGALGDAGLVPVTDAEDEDVVAVVTGYGPDVLWRDIMRTAVRVREGLFWVATNTDTTIPTDFGIAPGHGVLVETLSRFTGVEPLVAGKPQPPLLLETIARVTGSAPLMVGDRLDTDIEGARNAGVPSLLVLTGVTGLRELVEARPVERPDYLSPALDGAFAAHPVPVMTDGAAELGGWRAAVNPDGRLTVAGTGRVEDWWRVVACAGWAHLDHTGAPVVVDGLAAPAAGSDPGR